MFTDAAKVALFTDALGGVNGANWVVWEILLIQESQLRNLFQQAIEMKES